jgi:hypothetical protein
VHARVNYFGVLFGALDLANLCLVEDQDDLFREDPVEEEEEEEEMNIINIRESRKLDQEALLFLDLVDDLNSMDDLELDLDPMGGY